MRTLFLAGVAALSLSCGACAYNSAPAPAPAPRAETAPSESPDVMALQHLTRILIDASALYNDAAVKAEDPRYARALIELAGDRKRMADAFQAQIAAMGREPAEMGEALGTGHRAFMEARTLGDKDTKVAVEEALRGESYLDDEMSTAATQTELSDATRAFIEARLPEVRAGRDRLQAYAASLQG